VIKMEFGVCVQTVLIGYCL